MNLNDSRYLSLRAQGFTGHVNTMLLRWLQANGATSGNISDAWREMLSANGRTGHVNDSWRGLLNEIAPPEIGRHINDLERWFWSPTGGGGALYRYTFDGVDQYATIPDWTPNGLPFSVEIKAAPMAVDGLEHRLWSGDAVLPAGRITTTDRWGFRYTDVTGTARNLSSASLGAIAGQVANVLWNNTASNSQIRVDGEGVGNTNIAKSSSADPISLIGAGTSAPAQLWHGPLWSLKLNDDSPIQNTNVCRADSARHVDLASTMWLFGLGAWEIEFDYIRLDKTGTAAPYVMGSQDGQSRVSLYDSGAAFPDRIQVVRGGSDVTDFDGALADIAQGQHCTVKITFAFGVGMYCYVDGVEKGGPFGAANATDLPIDQLYSANGGYPGSGAAFQNIRITDITNDREWLYTLDEGTGTLAHDTGASGFNNNGTWVPDTSWQFIPNNSRHYPINEGPDGAGTIVDTIGGYDGTIVNYDPAGWE